jgi:hypothetical protein
MPDESLNRLARPYIPDFSGGITSARDENILIRAEGETVGEAEEGNKTVVKFAVGQYKKDIAVTEQARDQSRAFCPKLL